MEISLNWVDRVNKREFDILFEASQFHPFMWPDEFRKRVEPIIDRLIAEDREICSKLSACPNNGDNHGGII